MIGLEPRLPSRRSLLVLAAVLCTCLATAQEPQTPVVRVTTRLVLVDVVVTDRRGQPVAGLTADDFTLLEDGKPQLISVFSYERPGGAQASKQRATELSPLPSGTFTNHPAYRRPPGPPIVLLLDGLNTPVQDQIYVREKMLRYVAELLQPDQYMAVVGMGERLWLLQDFTSNPRMLMAALEQWKSKPSTALAREERELDLLIAKALAAGQEGTAAALRAFETQEVAAGLDLRVQSTLGALESLARALANYPGRKNLVWVSAAFPFTFRPDNPRDAEQFREWKDYAGPIRRVGRLLADAQVAVYPVDARGLMDSGTGSAEQRSLGTAPVGRMDQLRDVMEGRALAISDPHDTMNAIAEETGGVAFYNRNDLDRAVAQGVADGSTYYLLGYYAKNSKWDGTYRRIEVKLAQPEARVRHRTGYYAIDTLAEARETGKEERGRELLSSLAMPLPATLVTFRARATPSATPQGARVRVEVSVDAKSIDFETGASGRPTSSLDFLVTAYSPEGALVTYVYQTLVGSLRPEAYARLEEQHILYQTELKLQPGLYELRLAVRDNHTGFIGTLRLPLVLNPP